MVNLILFVLLFLVPESKAVQAQTLLELQKDKSYEDTEKFLVNNESILKKVKEQTNARSKEIEDLTNRVDRLITNMGSANEDTKHLRSELLVANDLLKIERQTTKGLREEKKVLDKQLADLNKKESALIEQFRLERISLREKQEIIKLNAVRSEQSLRKELQSLRSDHARALKRLNQTIEEFSNFKTNKRRFMNKLKKANEEIRRLRRELANSIQGGSGKQMVR